MVKHLALIWMSAGNSYFNERRIGQLLNFAETHFQKILLLSPDQPAEHTFKALGYPEHKAKRKAKLNANLLINRAKRELQKIKNHDKFSFVDWEHEVFPTSVYKKRYEEILSLFINNVHFRDDVRKTTQKVISNKFHDDLEIERVLDEACYYLIEELSFVLACPLIYGADYVTYLYHQPWEVFENLISGKYDGKKREKLSFVLTGIT